MSQPELSVVLVARDGIESVAEVLRCLRDQTMANRLELVIVAPSTESLGAPDGAFAPFAAAQVVEVGRVSSRGHAAAAGVRAAATSLVAFVENHAYPTPGWAEALVSAHAAGDRAVVGPAVVDAAPVTSTARANHILSYGRFAPPVAAGETDCLPYHNSAWRREVLLARGERLGELLDREGLLQAEVRATGACLWLEPRAVVAHSNEFALRHSLYVVFHFGRLFAVERAKEWPAARRLLQAAGFPLFPFLRLPSVLHNVHRTGQGDPVLFAVLMLHLGSHSLGEAVGYVVGAGGATTVVTDHEFDHRVHPGREPVAGDRS
jgi:hypothetical protein